MRIIGGQFRGRRLKAPKGRGTRPTPDRVREALFSILGDRIVGARVVELFGGTGSLGLESLSRGASEAVFFETARGARLCLEENIRTLGVERACAVHPRSAYQFARVDPAPFDLAFCDPPFKHLEEPDSRGRLARLLESLPLSPGGLILLEHRAGSLGGFLPPGRALEEVREWGTTGMAFFSPASGPPETA